MNAENKNNPSKKKRVLRTLAVLILLAVLLPLATSYYVMASTENRILTPEEAAKLDADAILVLGARVWDDGQPSAI